MRRRWIGFGMLALGSTLLGGALLSCSSGGADDEGGPGFQGGDGAGANGSTGSVGVGTGSFGAPQDAAPPPIAPVAEQDAGADAPFLCDGLDQTQPVVLYLSADDSNSMASPAHARELLELGMAPGGGQIRS